MYVCMYICMNICMYVFIHTHTHTNSKKERKDTYIYRSTQKGMDCPTPGHRSAELEAERLDLSQGCCCCTWANPLLLQINCVCECASKCNCVSVMVFVSVLFSSLVGTRLRSGDINFHTVCAESCRLACIHNSSEIPPPPPGISSAFLRSTLFMGWLPTSFCPPEPPSLWPWLCFASLFQLTSLRIARLYTIYPCIG